MGRVVRPDAAAQIAARQEGSVTREQLREAGLSDEAIDYGIEIGRLHPQHRGVFLAGHPVPPPRADRWSARLACGPTGAVSHRSAAEDWVLLPPDRHDDDVDITIVGRSGRTRPGIRIHRPRVLDPRDVTRLHGIPTTTVPRTLLDIAEQVDRRLLERAFDEALTRRLTTTRELRRLLDRSPGRRGLKPLGLLLDRTSGSTLSRSDLEELMLALIRAARLPEPELNILLLGRYMVDFVWREFRLVVEVDGGPYHASRKQRTNDNRRDSDLRAAGWNVERFSDYEIEHEPQASVARLSRALYAAA